MFYRHLHPAILALLAVPAVGPLAWTGQTDGDLAARVDRRIEERQPAPGERRR